MSRFLSKRSPTSSSEDLYEEMASEESLSSEGSVYAQKRRKKERLDLWTRIVRPDGNDEAQDPEYSLQKDMLAFEKNQLRAR